MGNEASNQTPGQIQQSFTQNYNPVRKVQDPRLGEVTIVQSKKTKKFFGVVTIKANSEEQIENYRKLFTQRNKLSHPNVAAPSEIFFKKESTYCGSFHKIQILFEYHEHNLAKDIAQRSMKENFYSEEELWYIAESIIQSMAYLSQNKVPYGYLTPESVFMGVDENQEQVYKMFVQPSVENAKTTYFQVLSGKKKASYISPKELLELRKKVMKPSHDARRSDVYSMGMTLLEAATLTPIFDCYDQTRNIMNQRKIDNKLLMVSQKYSEELGQFLREVLSPREENRPDFLSLASRLSTNAQNGESGQSHPLSPPRVPTDEPQFQAQKPVKSVQPVNSRNVDVTPVQYQMDPNQSRQVQQPTPVQPFQPVHPNQVQQQRPPQQGLSVQQPNLPNQPKMPATVKNPTKKSVVNPGQVQYGLKDFKTEMSQNVKPPSNYVPYTSNYQQQSVAYPVRVYHQSQQFTMPSQNASKRSTYQFTQPQKNGKENYQPYQFQSQVVQPGQFQTQFQKPVVQPQSTETTQPTPQVQNETVKKVEKTEMKVVDENAPKVDETVTKMQQSVAPTNVFSKPVVVPNFSYDFQQVKDPVKAPQTQENAPPQMVNQFTTQTTPYTYQSYQFTNGVTGLQNPSTLTSYQRPNLTTTTNPYVSKYTAPVQPPVQKLPEVTEEPKTVETTENTRPSHCDVINKYKQKYGITNLGEFKPVQPFTYQPMKPYQPYVPYQSQKTTVVQQVPTPVVQAPAPVVTHQPEVTVPVTQQPPVQVVQPPTEVVQQVVPQETTQVVQPPQPVQLAQPTTVVPPPPMQMQQQQLQQDNQQPPQQLSFPQQTQPQLSMPVPPQQVVVPPQQVCSPDQKENVATQLQQNQEDISQYEQVQFQQQPVQSPEQQQFVEQQYEQQQQFEQQQQYQQQQDQEQDRFTQQEYSPEQEGVQEQMEIPGSDSKERVEEEYQDGSIYYGEKLNGLRHGFGKFSYADGGVYEGEWQFGTMEGYGKLYYPSENLAYEGEWKRNAFNGNGKVYNEEPSDYQGAFDFTNFDELEDHWDRFEGEFVEDFKEGLGTLFLVNGEKYVGEFKQDMVNGQGTFHCLNGDVVQGEWVCNKLVEQTE